MSDKNIDKTIEVPVPKTFWEYLKSFGPGFVIVLTWLGSGDIVSAGVAGGNYGYTLMWAMVFALLMRFFFVTTIAKYQLCNPQLPQILIVLEPYMQRCRNYHQFL